MAEAFNPYRDWLGFSSGRRPTNHYALFGLKPLESDADKIRRASAQLVAKVRNIRPGDRTLEWQEIIREILNARACLIDPAAKAAYDARLRGRRRAAKAASRDAPGATSPASPPAKGGGQQTAKGKTGAPIKQKPTVKVSKTASPPSKPAGGAAGQQARSQAKKQLPQKTPKARSPGQQAAGKQPPPTRTSQAGSTKRPAAPASQPPAAVPPAPIPASGSDPSVPPQPIYADPPPPSDGSPGGPDPSQISGGSQSSGGQSAASAYHQEVFGYPLPASETPQDAPAPPPADPPPAGQAWPGLPVAEAVPPANAPPTPDAHAAPEAVPFKIDAKPPARLRRRRKTSIANRTVKWLLSLLVLLAIVIGLFEYQRYLKEQSLARLRKPEPEAVEAPKVQLPDPAIKAAEELRRKKANLQKNLTDLVAALAARDLSGAQSLVAQARANASSPDDEKTVDKYEKLSEDVREFWRIIGDRVSKFRPQEAVALGKTRIIVVEAGDGRFAFKYGRKIFSGPVEGMPSWLVVILADGDLTSDGRSKELYGAFLAVDPDGDRARAKALWSEAANMGVKIDESLPSLDSLWAMQEQ